MHIDLEFFELHFKMENRLFSLSTLQFDSDHYDTSIELKLKNTKT